MGQLKTWFIQDKVLKIPAFKLIYSCFAILRFLPPQYCFPAKVWCGVEWIPLHIFLFEGLLPIFIIKLILFIQRRFMNSNLAERRVDLPVTKWSENSILNCIKSLLGVKVTPHAGEKTTQLWLHFVKKPIGQFIICKDICSHILKSHLWQPLPGF